MEETEKNNERTKILIGMPVPRHRRVDIQAAFFCGRLSASKNVDFIGKLIEEKDYARNLIINDFLAGDYTHLFFIDADTAPPPRAIAKLLAHDRDICAAVTPMIIDGKRYWSASRTLDENNVVEWVKYDRLGDTPFKALAIGGTSMLIKRRVFETIGWPWFKFQYDADGGRIGEDIWFSDQAIKAGFDLWVDPTIKCNHMQTKDLLQLF